MIIWLASYPRSGNTFFRLLLNHLYGLHTFSVYDDPVFDELQGISEVVGHQKLPAPLDVIREWGDPYFVKTHELPTDDSPAIYLVRDGRDAVVSYARYSESFYGPFSWRHRARKLLGISNYPYILRDLITLFNIRPAAWSDHVGEWRRREAPTITVRYEDLLQDPVARVHEALKDVGYQPQDRGHMGFPSFEELHEKWPQFFRRGKVSNWREEMTEELHDLFWRYHGDTMRELGYNR